MIFVSGKVSNQMSSDFELTVYQTSWDAVRLIF